MSVRISEFLEDNYSLSEYVEIFKNEESLHLLVLGKEKTISGPDAGIARMAIRKGWICDFCGAPNFIGGGYLHDDSCPHGNGSSSSFSLNDVAVPYKKKKIPTETRWAVWERDNFTCVICGSRNYLTIDHIIPERSGGNLKLENLQTLCRSCNSKKGTKCSG